MYKLSLVCLILIFSVFNVSAQPSRELLSQIKNGRSDTAQIKRLLKLGDYYVYKPGEYKNDLDSAYNTYAKALYISKTLKDINWQNKTLIAIGICDREAGNYDHGIECYMQVVNYYKKVKLPKEEASAWYDTGDLLPANSKINIEKKIKFFKRADSIYKELNLRVEQTDVLKAIADAHLNEGQLDLAERELLQVIVQYKKEGYKKLQYTYDLLGAVARQKGELQKKLYYELEVVKSVANTSDSTYADYFYYKLGNTYNDLKKYHESLYWNSKALNIAYKNPDSGPLYLYAALHISNLISLNKGKEALTLLNNMVKRKPPANEDEKISIYQSYGKIYDALKDYGSARQNYTKMISMIEKQGKDRGVVNQYIIINNHIIDYLATIKFFVSIKDYNKAGFYLKKVQLFSDSLESPVSKKDIHFYSFLLDSLKGDYLSALKNYQQYKQINDSIFNVTKSKQIAETDIKYQTAQKILDIKLLRDKQEAQKAELQKINFQKNVTFGGTMAVMILAGLAYNGYRNKLKSNKLLRSKQAEINQQNNSLQQLIYDKDELLSEKDWLLREVHHRVKNNLQIIISLLNSQSAYLESGKALDAIRESQNRVQAISLIHQKLYGPGQASGINVKNYVSDLTRYLADCFDIGRKHIVIISDVDNFNMDLAQAVPLGLLLNESITNAIKYAFERGGQILIHLMLLENNEVVLNIADNGIGLPPDFDPQSNKSLGMQMMNVLSKQLGGRLLMSDNAPGLKLHLTFQLEKVLPKIVDQLPESHGYGHS